jgi:NtrC-family two-component system sensor histidine kinase KinB
MKLRHRLLLDYAVIVALALVAAGLMAPMVERIGGDGPRRWGVLAIVGSLLAIAGGVLASARARAIRRSIEDRLLAEQQRNRAVLSNIRDGLVLLDGAGRIERLNAVAVSQFGADAADGVGRQPGAVFAVESLDAAVRDALRDPAHRHVALADIERGSGAGRRVLACTLAPFADPHCPGLLIVVRDVTVERDFERLRTEFVLHASHELRTPVATLSMAAELLAERSRPEPGSTEADLLDTLCGESMRMARLLDDLLDLGRLRAAPRHPCRESCAAGELAIEALDHVRLLAGNRHQRLEARVDDEAAILHVDRELLMRCLDNLLGNAVRHAPDNGCVALGIAVAADGSAHIDVVDDGPGIPEGQREEIFEPLRRGPDRPGGAGLGLALAREIVELHGGTIAVDDAPGGGARFIIDLPNIAERGDPPA